MNEPRSRGHICGVSASVTSARTSASPAPEAGVEAAPEEVAGGVPVVGGVALVFAEELELLWMSPQPAKMTRSRGRITGTRIRGGGGYTRNESKG